MVKNHLQKPAVIYHNEYKPGVVVLQGESWPIVGSKFAPLLEKCCHELINNLLRYSHTFSAKKSLRYSFLQYLRPFLQ